MTTIIEKEDFNIIQDEISPTKFTIQFTSYVEHLIKSLTKTGIILGATSTNNFHTLIFKATTVTTFPQYIQQHKWSQKSSRIPLPKTSKIIAHLVTQLNYLITNHSKTFIGYSPENIIVIDENKFVYISCDQLHDIDEETKSILITSPFSQNDFFTSPEQNKITELPSRIHYKTTYFSLASLILYTLSDKDDFNIHIKDDNNKSKREQLNYILDGLPINSSKIYWLLSRCLVEEPKNRSILFI